MRLLADDSKNGTSKLFARSRPSTFDTSRLSTRSHWGKGRQKAHQFMEKRTAARSSTGRTKNHKQNQKAGSSTESWPCYRQSQSAPCPHPSRAESGPWTATPRETRKGLWPSTRWGNPVQCACTGRAWRCILPAQNEKGRQRGQGRRPLLKQLEKPRQKMQPRASAPAPQCLGCPIGKFDRRWWPACGTSPLRTEIVSHCALAKTPEETHQW